LREGRGQASNRGRPSKKSSAATAATPTAAEETSAAAGTGSATAAAAGAAAVDGGGDFGDLVGVPIRNVFTSLGDAGDEVKAVWFILEFIN